MKILLAALAFLIFQAVLVFACKSGETNWQGTCAADLRPADAVSVPEVKPSTEKPSRHPESAWQRGEVTADTPPSFKTEAEEADAQLKWAKGHLEELHGR